MYSVLKSALMHLIRAGIGIWQNRSIWYNHDENPRGLTSQNQYDSAGENRNEKLCREAWLCHHNLEEQYLFKAIHSKTN
jgi:hypothetical protein